MTIFTPEAKAEIKKFLPHYIVASAFLIGSLVSANVINNIISANVNKGQPEVPTAPQHQEQMAPSAEGSEKLPSEYNIGIAFPEAMNDKSKPVVVEFFADWCGFSKKISPAFEQVSKEIDDVNFSMVDTQKQENYYLSQKYKIDKFPTILIINPANDKVAEVLLEEKSFTGEGLKEQVEETLEQVK